MRFPKLFVRKPATTRAPRPVARPGHMSVVLHPIALLVKGATRF